MSERETIKRDDAYLTAHPDHMQMSRSGIARTNRIIHYICSCLHGAERKPQSLYIRISGIFDQTFKCIWCRLKRHYSRKPLRHSARPSADMSAAVDRAAELVAMPHRQVEMINLKPTGIGSQD